VQLEETPDTRLSRMVTEAQSLVGTDAEGLTPEERKEDSFLNDFIHNIPKKKNPGKKDPKAKGKSQGKSDTPPPAPPTGAPSEPPKEPSKTAPKQSPKKGGKLDDLLSLFGGWAPGGLGKPGGGGCSGYCCAGAGDARG